jgi:hypothetical protein
MCRQDGYFMKRLGLTIFFCLLFLTFAQCDESWVFFHSEKEYFFEQPHMGIPLKPLYQRETYYYDKNSVESSGFFVWKTVRARVKVESWGVYSNKESMAIWEVDCETKIVREYAEGSRHASSHSVDSGDAVADFYKALCF